MVEGLVVLGAADLFERAAVGAPPALQAFAALRPFISGTDERARVMILRFLTSPPLPQVIWPEIDPDNLLLQLETMDGRMVERTIGAIRFEAPNRRVYTAGWKYLLDDRIGVAPSLLEPRRILFRSELENGGLYVRLNGIVDDDNGPLDEQLSNVLPGAPQGGWRWIVVDLRGNGGGNYEKAVAFTRALPDTLSNDGSLWLLSDNATLSAAIVTLARAKYFAGARGHMSASASGTGTRSGPSRARRSS